MGKRIFLSPPHLGDDEIRYIEEAFSSNYIAPLGPQVDAFEKEFADYTGLRNCLAVSSGTAAMHLVLRKIGVGPGDLVIASTLTFIGSVSPVAFQGGRPVFVDCDPTSWNMDPALLQQTLADCMNSGLKPKAVIPTDLYGQCANYEEIGTICRACDVPLIIDAAEALGATATVDGEVCHAGRGGDAAVFSFNGNKIITTSGGGMLASDDEELIDYARYLSQQARRPFAHYEHAEIGYNYRMSNILAAIGRGQLRVLDERVDRKRQIFSFYTNALSDLPGVGFMPEADYGKSTRWLTVITIDPSLFGTDREMVRLALEKENIESRPVWKPMHRQPVFDIQSIEQLQHQNTQMPMHNVPAGYVGNGVSDRLFETGLCLPSGTAMDDSDLNRVVTTVRKCAEQQVRRGR